jgi:hypothetical protein
MLAGDEELGGVGVGLRASSKCGLDWLVMVG